VIHPRLARIAPARESDVARVRSLLDRVRTEARLLGVTPEQLWELAQDTLAPE
jgi:hypothetical protein